MRNANGIQRNKTIPIKNIIIGIKMKTVHWINIRSNKTAKPVVLREHIPSLIIINTAKIGATKTTRTQLNNIAKMNTVTVTKKYIGYNIIKLKVVERMERMLRK